MAIAWEELIGDLSAALSDSALARYNLRYGCCRVLCDHGVQGAEKLFFQGESPAAYISCEFSAALAIYLGYHPAQFENYGLLPAVQCLDRDEDYVGEQLIAEFLGLTS